MAKESNKKEKETTEVEKKVKKTVEKKEEVKAEVKSTKKSSKETVKKSSKETTKKAKAKSGFFKDFKAELKKVVWPSSKEVINGTTAVIVIVLITTLLVFVLDFTFEKIIVNGTEKLTSIVSSNDDNNEANTEDVVVDADLKTEVETTTNPETTVE